MQTFPNTNSRPERGASKEKHVEEVLRFAQKLGMHSHPEQLLRALPAELCAFVECTTAALIFQREGELSFHFNHLNGTRVVAQKLQWADVYLGRVLAYPAGGIDGG